MSILVIDIGTSGLRAGIVRADATLEHVHHRALAPSTPFPGLVEFDPREMADAALAVATAALAAGGPVDAVGIANQRASTIVWDRATGTPTGPGLGWQDLRTIGECLTLAADHGLQLAPNQTATKAAWLWDQVDQARDRDLCVGTVDSWLAWTLTGGAAHVTDHTNAAVTGLYDVATSGWSAAALDALRLPPAAMPVITDTSGPVGVATVLDGAPPITSLVGDQQASLVGQGCVVPGAVKATFGTGGMLDQCRDTEAPSSGARSAGGTFPIVAWSRGGVRTFGVEAVMLSAGTNIEWLRDDLGVIADAAESDAVAGTCAHADGVVYVPALLGLGTPHWDYGARGTLLGLTRGTGRPQLVRAVLEGIAHRGADLLEAAEADTGLVVDVLRVDGGMSANGVFVQALADATQRVVEVSPVTEATALGAAFLAGLEVGTWAGMDDVAATWSPARRLEPVAVLDRDRWREAVDRAKGWIPELSALHF
jgi:glycerol kinase